VRARTPNQRVLLEECAKNDLIFAIGPAGTGKTYTAIALAVRALKNREIKKIILSRPAVEAGENLGFLPGDLKEKIDPYLQPLYDALQDMIPPKKLEDFMKEGIIEIAPLAFMRGRTLSNAFVILDEAQNTTINQLKMFLTRMGLNAKFIITGDVTQIDLPRRSNSGLIFAMKLLQNIESISVVQFNTNDIVRHRLVRDIVDAYQNYYEKQAEEKEIEKEKAEAMEKKKRKREKN
jgi:phosphate starvation-inducible PhoH-like protein